ncbi:MAG: enoyl-CoA hydratase/isomerase family protein [Actinomycetota bacterium]
MSTPRDDVHAVVLRGSAGHFSAGVPIGELPEVLLDRDADGNPLDHLSAADRAVSSVAKPTVAVVEGCCMGGGWQIASACDFVVAADDARFAITPAKLGIVYPRPGIDRLVRCVGPSRAKYLLLTGTELTGHQAWILGLVADADPRDEFAERADRLVRDLVARSRFSVHTMKRLIDLAGTDEPGLDEAWTRAWADMASGPDLPIGVDAFLRGRAPAFTWTP